MWTNGAVNPEMAVVEAAKILRKHLNPFVQYFEIGEQTISEDATAMVEAETVQDSKLSMSIADLDLSVRASNCLESANITSLNQLTSLSESDLLKIRSFGKTSLNEIKRKLEDLGLSLADNGAPESDEDMPPMADSSGPEMASFSSEDLPPSPSAE